MTDLKQVAIERFSPAYQDEVIDLIVEIQRKEFGIDITAEDQPDLSDIPDYYQKGAGNFWVALWDGKVVGTISLLDIGDSQAALRKMFVKKQYRGPAFKAAGSLLAELLAWARGKNLESIFLGTTPKFLAAHRFYEKNGFTEIGKESLPASFPVMTVDTKFYRYEV